MHAFLEKYLPFFSQFIPDSTPQTTIGLDIGKSSCKFLELKNKGESIELINWGIEPIVHNDLAAVVKKISQKINSPFFSPKTAVFGKGTLIRFFEMPKMTLLDLRKSLGFEADKYFPFPKNQIYLDCYILEKFKTEESKMLVLVAAVKKEIIDERMQLFNHVGIPVDFVGINAIAIANVWQESKLTQSSSPAAQGQESLVAAILDIGEEVSNLIIFQENSPLFIRDIFFGGRDFTKSISGAMGLDFNDAEYLKCNPLKENYKVVFNACESVLMNLVPEVRISFDYFTTEKNLMISKLYITGGGALLEGFAEYLAKNLEIPVEIWNPLARLKTSSSITLDPIQATRFSVALGLALYG